MIDLEKLGGNFGDSFDMGEKYVKEVWGLNYPSAEKKFIESVEKFIQTYSL
jgi:hypothetical protein